MAQIAIYPYSRNSKSAKDLTAALGGKLMFKGETCPEGFKAICWGSHYGAPTHALNQPQHVSKAVNKITTFSHLNAGGVRTVPWTTNKEEAKQWIRDSSTVMCRTLVDSSSGKGIVVAEKEVDLVAAPLYTKFIDKDAEYRVHVFDGEIIDQRRKVRATDGRPVGDRHIHTHSNGYVFQFDRAPSDALVQAKKAVKALGLDFGAVDVIVKDDGPVTTIAGCTHKTIQAYVLEVNTAPGLTGATLDYYASAIKRKFGL